MVCAFSFVDHVRITHVLCSAIEPTVQHHILLHYGMGHSLFPILFDGAAAGVFFSEAAR